MAFPFLMLNIAYSLEVSKNFYISFRLSGEGNCVILQIWENHKAKGGFTLLFHSEGSGSPPDERKEGDAMYVTYQDLIQIGIFVVALANLIYQIYKGKKK